MRTQAHIRQFKKLRHRRRLSRLLWTLGFLLLALGLVHLFSGWMLGTMITRHLQQQTGAAVYIDSAYWIGPATVRLEDLIIAVDPNRLSETALVQVGRVDCSFSLINLLRLQRRVRSVTVEDAVVQVRYDHDRSGWNFSSLPFMNEPRQPAKVPVVYVDNALLRVQTVENGRVQTLTNVGLQGQILSENRGRQYRFSLETTPRAAFYGSRLDGIWQRGKGQGQVTLVGQVRMPLTYIYANAWNLEQIRLDYRYQKDQMAINNLSCQMGAGRMNLQGNLIGPSGHRRLDVQLQLENMPVTPTPRPNAIVYAESILRRLDPALQRFLRRFRPEGVADMSLQINGQLSDLAQSEITGQIFCRDISVLDRKFPYRLEKMIGTIDLTGKNLTLQDLHAWHGPSAFVISGGVDNMGPDARIRLQVTSDDLLLTDDIKQALPPSLQQKWFEFAPTGKCAIKYDFLRRPDRSRHLQLTADLLDVGCLYDRYPYPLDHLTGTIVFEPNSVELKNVTARPGADQQITIEGTVARAQTPAPVCDLWIRTHRLALDQTFRNTFRKAQREMLDKFEVDGRMDLDMHVKGPVRPQKMIPFQAKMTVQAASMSWKRFPIPFRDLLLKASITPEQMDIESLTAACGRDGRCRMSGQIRPAHDDTPRFSGSFAVSAEDLLLDEAFWKAVRVANIYPAAFSRVRAEGLIDLDGQFTANDLQSTEFSRQMTIHFRDGSLYAVGKDWKSGPVTGTVQVRDKQIELRDWVLDQLPVNETFCGLLPPDKAGLLASLNPSAMLHVDLRQALWNTDPRDSAFDAQGRIDIRQGAVPRLSVDQVEGFWEGRIARRSGQNSLEGNGRFGAQSVRVLGRTITGLAGPWNADPNSGLLICEPIVARCYDGNLSGKLRVETAGPDLPYRAEVVFQNIRLDPLLKAGRPDQQEQPLAEGSLRGSIDLAGRLRQFEDTQGRIHLEADGLKLGRESLFGKALTMMQLRRPSEYTFNEMYIEAFLEKGLIRTERILFAGENSVYQGTGTLNLKEQTIRMELTAFGRRRGEEPSLLSALAENLGAALARVEITGTLSQPNIQPVPLPIFQRPFGLFGPPEEGD